VTTLKAPQPHHNEDSEYFGIKNEEQKNGGMTESLKHSKAVSSNLI
jgi:hypothetical protein